MFLNYHFVLFSASTILLFTWFIVPYFYLKEYMSVHGYDENDASDMISISGVASTFGMVNFFVFFFFQKQHYVKYCTYLNPRLDLDG